MHSIQARVSTTGTRRRHVLVIEECGRDVNTSLDHEASLWDVLWNQFFNQSTGVHTDFGWLRNAADTTHVPLALAAEKYPARLARRSAPLETL